ncbi:SLC37A3 isoform 11, partial [Pan troglodytes]
YSIQDDSSVAQVKAISFYQACCLPGVIPYLVSLIRDKLGWMWVFYFFILMTSCTIVFISPLIVREIFSLVLRRQAHILRE